MKNCGACYYRDSTWSLQHREMSARCDHNNAPEESLLELRVGADSVVSAPYWCPLKTEDTKMADEIRHTYTFITDTNVVMLRSHYEQLVKERDEARHRARRACQVLVAEIGADGPADVDSVAERAAAEIRESRRDFVRVADALGLVSTDDTGRIGQVARVDEVVATACSIARLHAEVEMLRGVGCREAKAGEPESGPCGVCLRCAEERGAKWALDAAHKEVVWAVDQDRANINVRSLTGLEVCDFARKHEP